MTNKIRPIAIYLPQFHPIPENNKWWGNGFTEWTNVTKAKPLFDGHYQPHLPADLGFYDLRLPEVRQAQADLARDHGIYGFCYYHYWFSGRRILERPFQEVFESGEPNFPFMLCWANEDWTRTWDGDEKEILLKQKYSDEDDKRHIKKLIPYFKDRRYIKIYNKPVIAIYRSTLLPNPGRTIQIWRDEMKKVGMEIYICRFESFGETGKEFIEKDGFDASIDFQPFGNYIHKYLSTTRNKTNSLYFKKIAAVFNKYLFNYFNKNNSIKVTNNKESNIIIDYSKYVEFCQNNSFNYKCYPSITPMWDNSARRKKGFFIFENSTPQIYGNWLKNIISNFTPFSKEENFIFINAWNEWAEGNHLEPCQRWGKSYLEITKQVLNLPNK